MILKFKIKTLPKKFKTRNGSTRSNIGGYLTLLNMVCREAMIRQ